MIRLQNVTKTFGEVKALDNVDVNIPNSTIYGLIGSNGSGKSTILKLVCGAYRQDSGEILVENERIWDNAKVKKQIIFLSDDQYFLPNSSITEMAAFYRSLYDSFDENIYKNLCDIFRLDLKRKINTFSKGMQKQTSVLLGLSCKPKYLLCDETFDGLDPVVRQLVKKLLSSQMSDMSTTTIIASHNLRELEDICDNIGLIHKGSVLFERDLDDLKLEIHNVQCIYKSASGEDCNYTEKDFPDLNIISFKRTGSLIRMAVRGNLDGIKERLNQKNPLFLESLPLTLEEIFINEMEGIGYDFTNIL